MGAFGNGRRAAGRPMQRFLAISVLLWLFSGCARPEQDALQHPRPLPETARREAERAAAVDDSQADAAFLPLPLVPVDASQWLFVEKVQEGARGGWATGSFDPERNKIDITTHDVAAFAIDVERIPIAWERLVIIGIDGINSELRRRDYRMYHFVRDSAGQWIVREP